MNEKKVQPFDAFSVVYKVLVWVGYFPLLNKPKNRFKRVSHQMYRILAFLLIIVYNLQHLIFIIKDKYIFLYALPTDLLEIVAKPSGLWAISRVSTRLIDIDSYAINLVMAECGTLFGLAPTSNRSRRDNMEDVFDALMLEIPHFNLLVKYLTLNLHIPRINKMNKLLNEPIFAADSKTDENLLLRNKTGMHRLSKSIYIGITIAALFWPTTHFARRYQDETAVVPSYVPFDTDTWGKFSISVVLEVLPFVWIGYGHMSLDCVVAIYYAQTEVQLKIIKHNIEHLFNTSDADTSKSGFLYRDAMDKNLKRRLVYYIQRYEKLTWYTKEIDKVFNPAISFQFFTSTLSLCTVAYQMSSTPVATVPFIFLIVLIFIFPTQIFLYCYFGNAVHCESQSVVDSLYLSDWLSVSPQFRRLLLIVMLRWSRSLRPTISCIIPLSLNTFVTFCRSAYSLYAVLSTQKI